MNIDSKLKVHYTQLAPAAPGVMLAKEWETYRREIGRLLAEGREGQHVIISGDTILGCWATHQEAREAGIRHGLVEPFFISKIETEQIMLKSGYSKWLN